MSAALARRSVRDYSTAAPDGDRPGRRRRLALVPDHQPPAPSHPAPEAPTAGATVVRLLAPSDYASVAPLRLTRRGVGVLAVAVAIVAGAVVSLAAWSAPAATRSTAPTEVTVRLGDTLWALALRVAPQTDPRAEVVTLRRLNNLSDTTLSPGQTLRTR